MTVIAKSTLSNNLADLEWTRDVTRPTAYQIRASFWRMVSLLERDTAVLEGCERAVEKKGAASTVPNQPKRHQHHPPHPPPSVNESYLRRCQEFLQQNAEGDTQLHVAIVQELPIMVAEMVKSVPHPGLLNVQNDDRQTALHLAVLTRQRDIVRCLLDAGADTGKRDRLGNTALHIACQMGDLTCVKELTKDRRGDTKALRTSHVKEHEQGIKVPSRYQINDESYHKKCDKYNLIDFDSDYFDAKLSSVLPQQWRQTFPVGDDEFPKSLSTCPEVKELEVRNFEGETCVHLAAIYSHVDVLGWLRLCGADLNAREAKGGNTALHIAIERKLEAVSRYLLDECVVGLKLGTKNYAGWNVFDLAVGIDPLLAGIIASIREVPVDKQYPRESPIIRMKAKKNPSEIAGMRSAHIRDAVALCDFLAELEESLEYNEPWDELNVSTIVNKYRREQNNSRGISFASIVGFGPHGALPHYQPDDKTTLKIDNSSTLVLDSGGHYLDGTTDVTRTLHFGRPTAFQREVYTRVLSGHIQLAALVFPANITTTMVDVLARQPLWQAGLDFLHGTGHGIGAFLGVHESPVHIAYRTPASQWINFEEGYFFSDEPGYYSEGEFGVRLENVLEVVKHETKYSQRGGPFFAFRPATLVPYEPKLIEPSLLTSEHRHWLNEYNKQVRTVIGAELKKQKRMKGFYWMMNKTDYIPEYCVTRTSAAGNARPARVAVVFVVAATLVVIGCWT